MEHFARIAFWIVTLFCLQAKPIYIPVHEALIPSMESRVKCPSDSKFYTPPGVEKQCITTALDCVVKELDGTVREECTDDKDDINRVLEFFDDAIEVRVSEGHGLTNSSECACETWPQKPLKEFLTKVETLLQQANVDASM